MVEMETSLRINGTTLLMKELCQQYNWKIYDVLLKGDY